MITLHVNGSQHRLDVPATAPLLQVLRNDLALNGPKYGCGLGQCGACLVLVDGVPARSCVVPAGGLQGRAVVTLEGLGSCLPPLPPGEGRGEGSSVPPLPQSASPALHPVQQAFIDAQAAQCGYCLNGMIIATVALLGTHPRPTPRQVRDALSHNLCRCGTHVEILQAVDRAALLLQAATPKP